MMRKIVNLSGSWDFGIPGGKTTQRKVPGSYYMCGESVYSRSFSFSPEAGRRYLLVLEGILYNGNVELNGIDLGHMLPYSEYRFDITEHLLNGENTLRITIRDLNGGFGPSLGWRNCSGIVRDVYLLDAESVYIDDVFFHCALSGNLEEAFCSAEVTMAHCPDGHPITAMLQGKNTEVITTGVCQDGKALLQWTIHSPHLWSPADPYLYQLTVTAGNDSYTMPVGIRSFEIRGNQFFLNGKPCFLAGVCRHDMQTDADGYTQTDEQILRDLRMIKEMGANFVRLVHYPHDKRVLQYADELGLMVSCEPGVWGRKMWEWQDAPDALEVLRRLVIRDRSHPSVIFWLTFNECFPTLEYMIDSVAVVRKNDPTRPVSAASFLQSDHAKELFDKAGMDFYTFHPYGRGCEVVTGGAAKDGSWQRPWQPIENLCRDFTGKPLVFTEWGGFYTNNNPGLFEEFVRQMLRFGEESCLAGMSYWSWSDIFEANRPAPACKDGILTEGLVTVDREPKGNYYVFMDVLKQLRLPYDPKTQLMIFGCGDSNGAYFPLTLPDVFSDTQNKAWAHCLAMCMDEALYPYPQKHQILKGPALPYDVHRLGMLDVQLRKGRPLAVNQAGGSVKIYCGRSCSMLNIIGNVTLSKGYPTDGAMGDVWGEYVLEYDDGSCVTVPLRNGIELTTTWGSFGSSRIDPQGAGVTRAFTLTHDLNWEIYHTNLLRLCVDSGKLLRQITCTVTVPDTTLLLYGITAE